MKRFLICIFVLFLFLGACTSSPSPTDDPRITPEIRRNAEIISKEFPFIESEEAIFMAMQLDSHDIHKIEKMAQYDLEEIFGGDILSRASAEEIETSIVIQIAEGAKCLTFQIYNGIHPLDFIPWGGGYEPEFDLPPKIVKPTVKRSDPNIPTRPFTDMITPEIERNAEIILEAAQNTDDEDALKLNAVQIIDKAVALELSKFLYTAYASELLSVRVEGTDISKFFMTAVDLEKEYRIILGPQGQVQEIWVFKDGTLIPLLSEDLDGVDWDD